MAGHYTSPQAGAPFPGESFYVSNDLDQTWTALAMPTGLFPTTGLSCSVAMTCAVGGTIGNRVVFADRMLYLACTFRMQIGNVSDGGSPVLVGTANGGASWTLRSFQIPANAPNYLGQSYISIGSISCCGVQLRGPRNRRPERTECARIPVWGLTLGSFMTDLLLACPLCSECLSRAAGRSSTTDVVGSLAAIASSAIDVLSRASGEDAAQQVNGQESAALARPSAK